MCLNFEFMIFMYTKYVTQKNYNRYSIINNFNIWGILELLLVYLLSSYVFIHIICCSSRYNFGGTISSFESHHTSRNNQKTWKKQYEKISQFTSWNYKVIIIPPAQKSFLQSSHSAKQYLPKSFVYFFSFFQSNRQRRRMRKSFFYCCLECTFKVVEIFRKKNLEFSLLINCAILGCALHQHCCWNIKVEMQKKKIELYFISIKIINVLT